MDLIYANAHREDLGVMMQYEMDLSYGADENNFECAVPTRRHCCYAGYYLYVPGTEYGGVIDGMEVDTDKEKVTYLGRTWHGILESKIILPLQTGESSESGVSITQTDADGASYIDRYLIVSGDARDIIAYLIDRCGLSNLFSVPQVLSGLQISGYQFERYTDLYSGLAKMLGTAGYRLGVEYKGDSVELSAVEKIDFSEIEEFDSDILPFDIKKKARSVNHLICLGSGQLAERTVIHLYVDADGNISKEQTFFGLEEYAQVYDYPNVESVEELERGGIERLKELWQTDELNIDLEDTTGRYNIGDKLGARDNLTGISVYAEITKKIVKLEDGKITTSYEVGE